MNNVRRGAPWRAPNWAQRVAPYKENEDMQKNYRLKIAGIFLSLIFSFSANAQNSDFLQKFQSPTLKPFSSDQEFEAYTQGLADLISAERKKRQVASKMKAGGAADMAAPASPMGFASEAKVSAQQESITNVQEQGVDEGDIVKVWNDYLVVLRRGKLFTIRLKEKDQKILRPVSHLEVAPAGYTGAGWYDEMLIYQNRIVVLGYSYKMKASELALFSVDTNGVIRHESTYFVDSNDYYSSRNYASRLQGNKLIFYMPYYLFNGAYGETPKAKLPEIRRWLKAEATAPGKTLIAKTDIYKPVQATMYPSIHMVVTCDLARADLNCSGKAVLGPYSRNFYVSPDAVYLWVSSARESWQEALPKEVREPNAMVYRMPLNDKTVSVLQASGTPIDQFSFKDSDGTLNVLLKGRGWGEAMWGAEFSKGDLALLRVAISRFSATPSEVKPTDYLKLPRPEGEILQNRYVGDTLLYGSGTGWYEPARAEKKVYIKNIRNNQAPQVLSLSHGVDRLEALGNNAVVVGSDQKNLKFSSVALGSSPQVRNTYTIAHAAQGETRSHGFFFKPSPAGGGVLGLPIRREGKTVDHLVKESAEVIFLKVSTDLIFSDLGTLVSKASETLKDNCKVSCVDWYGNSRPIFLGGRILALMGYELVEGVIEGSKIQETERRSFAP